MLAPVRPASPRRPDILHAGTHNGWVPAGVSIEVAGLTLPGGMLYVGKELPAQNGSGPDPALINPRLWADVRNPDWSGSAVGYWPSYSTISAQARGAYLSWLADGRSHPEAPISWVFLFFYGLERRVIVDAQEGPAARDLPLISAEVRRLLDLYGAHSSFHSYATQFLSLIDALSAKTGLADAAPPRASSSWAIPNQLRAGLGRFAVESRPVPADWALSWAHFHPEIYPRTPAQRCPEAFEQLFRARYAAHHGAGMRVQPDQTVLQHIYVAASAGIGQVAICAGLPDVLQLAAPTQALKALVEECTDALDAYSRYLGRHPDAKATLAATTLLPPELADHTEAGLLRLMAWVEERLGQNRWAVVDGGELIGLWPAADPGRLAKAEAVALAQLLGTRGVGIEPEVRLGGPLLSSGPAVLFRAEPRQPTAPSTAYSAATIMLRLAAAVSLADGQVSEAERARLRSHLASAMHLTGPERVRLEAHMAWVLASQSRLADRARLAGLTKGLAALDQAQRESVGDFLTTVATADGVVSPAEISTLTSIFRLLRLDPAAVYSRVHAVTASTAAASTAPASTAPAAEPLIVRHATEGTPGFAIPHRPADEAIGATPLRLDEAAIAAKLAETAAVSALLGSIFAEDTRHAEPTTPGTLQESEPREQPVAGLDASHCALLRALVARPSWSRADLESECAILSLLPDGALDTLNEAAYDTAGDPLADGEDTIHINLEVAQEMLA